MWACVVVTIGVGSGGVAVESGGVAVDYGVGKVLGGALSRKPNSVTPLHIVTHRSARRRRLDVKSWIVGLGVPGRKASLEYDWSLLSSAPLDLARGAVVRGDVRCEVWSKDKKVLRFWFHTAFV